MKIVLATGVYPPSLGGPATYAKALTKELQSKGVSVSVVTYGIGESTDPWSVRRVSLRGGPLLRWWKYARALRRESADADIVLAFSSISVGMPMILARLKRPRKILRLGGDFFWERYTDRGGTMGLKEWYASKGLVTRFAFCVTRFILNHFDHVVFSTNYQAELYKKHYLHLPPHCVIENALPAPQQLSQSMRMLRTSGMQNASFRLLYFGRFVGFKNLPALLEALRALPQVKLSLVGEGPMEARLRGLTRTLRIADRVSFLPPLHGTDKEKVFAAHDLLVIPSLTELSPHSALEARAAGLPVLLTEETGLSPELTAGMVLKELRTAEEISNAIRNVIQDYAAIATEATSEPPRRMWKNVAEEWMQLFSPL
ncbi:MAG: glycosyltransferase family 4 protein [Patescibacteria group bacterium]